MNQLDYLTTNIPFLGRLKFKILLIIGVLILLVLIPRIFIHSLSTEEKLVANRWCIEKILNKGQELIPNTYGVKLVINSQDCSEIMNFRDNGEVNLPGVNTYAYRGSWRVIGNTLYISNGKSKSEGKENSLYNGEYKLEIDRGKIKMISKNMMLLGREDNFEVRLPHSF